VIAADMPVPAASSPVTASVQALAAPVELPEQSQIVQPSIVPPFQGAVTQIQTETNNMESSSRKKKSSKSHKSKAKDIQNLSATDLKQEEELRGSLKKIVDNVDAST
jgi:hypothetical protein